MTRLVATLPVAFTIAVYGGLAGCTNTPCKDGFLMNARNQCVPDTLDTLDTTDTGTTTDGWVSLPDNCTAPDGLSDDPLQLVARPEDDEPQQGGPLYEMLDLAYAPTEELMYAVGQGGLIVWELQTPSIIGTFPPEGHSRYHQIELLSDGLVAVSHRDRGIEIINVSGDPSTYSVDYFWPIFGASGMAWIPPYLYVTSQDGELDTLKFKNEALTPVSTVYGLEAPWVFVIDGEHGWIADNLLGIVPIDLSDPELPVIGESVETVGGALDIVHHTNNSGQEVLYVATGSTGLQVFSVDEAGLPVAEMSIPYSNSIVSVAADEDTLWIVGHEDVAVLDISDALNPIPIGVEETQGFGLHVEAEGATGWVADWGQLAIYQVDSLVLAPSIDLSTDAPLMGDSNEVTVTLGNRGGATLNLFGATSTDPRVTILSSTDEVPSGESGEIKLLFTGDDQPLDATICLASNDPENPTLMLQLSDQSEIQSSIAYGETAPDFTLTDLDGTTHRLSEQLGHPVVLVYFATW